jgi:hypothetical protein
MAESTVENGLTTTWTVSVFTLGRMAGSTKESTKTTKNTGLEYIFGLMGVFIEVIGQEENSTD